VTSAPIPGPIELLRRYALPAKKRLGQNFLTDTTILDRIVSAGGIQSGSRVLEIGPGPCGLTSRLLAAGGDVVAIEADRDAAEFLERELAPGNSLEVILGDALGPELITALGSPPAIVVANLPYHVATEILFRLIEAPEPPELMVLMFQKEVAVRLASMGAERVFGIPSVAAGLTYWADIVMELPPHAFTPAPKVDSAVIRLRLRDEPLCAPHERALILKLASAAFQQRRKMIRRSLAGWGDALLPALERASIAETARPESMTVTDFVALARALSTDD
jgi:16S rRNA (adenine1518-N6/adenine1519-N6)-dimethyltransferase